MKRIEVEGKLAREFENFCEMLDVIADPYDPKRLEKYCEELRKNLPQKPEMATEDSSYLAIALKGQIKFSKSYPWQSFLNGEFYPWEKVKKTIQATPVAKTLIEFFTNLDEQVLQRAIMLCWLVQHRKNVNCVSF